MMKVLSPIADTVWFGICELFEFYLFTVNQFFSFDLSDIELEGRGFLVKVSSYSCFHP